MTAMIVMKMSLLTLSYNNEDDNDDDDDNNDDDNNDDEDDWRWWKMVIMLMITMTIFTITMAWWSFFPCDSSKPSLFLNIITKLEDIT